MNIEELQFSLSQSALDLVKLAVVFTMLLYLAFSVLVIRQTQLMTKTVTGKLDKLVFSLSWGYFLISIVVFLLALLFL